ncbi:hypothetical protein BHE74_00018102 [Ensete ventricosum]|nr:hypothetical protein GW17_00024110 [Ensete ventricosum]RWW73980.1 hypothetical protein BHE74_00018102 [Ensete ventricosum]RZR77053.1 hypothetical protein BHM03_00002029 [Ensete ventricosum]
MCSRCVSKKKLSSCQEKFIRAEAQGKMCPKHVSQENPSYAKRNLLQHKHGLNVPEIC